MNKETKEEMASRIKKLKKEFAELKKEVNKEEIKNGRWTPDFGDDYWVIECGDIAQEQNDSSPFDENLINVNKVFKTREEAMFELERQKVFRKIEKFEHCFTKEEWENDSVEKYFLYFDIDSKLVMIDFDYSLIRGIPYFKTREDAEACINEIGEVNLKRYYFGIK